MSDSLDNGVFIASKCVGLNVLIEAFRREESEIKCEGCFFEP